MQLVTIDPMVFAVNRPCGISRLWSSLIDGFEREKFNFKLAGNSGLPLHIRRHVPCRHGGQLYVPTLLSPTFNNRRNVQIVHDCIKELTYPSAKARLIKLRRRWLFQRATRLICVSEATRTDVRSIYGHRIADKATVIHNIIDAEKVRRLARQGSAHPWLAQGPLNELTGVYIGSRNNTKNFGECRTLLRAKPSVRLLVIGPDASPEEVKSFEAYGDRMRFVGPLPDEDMFATLAGSDFLFMPSTLEGFGMTVGESLSLGVPSLGLDTRVNTEVSGGTMYTFASGNVRDLNETLQAIRQAQRLDGRVQNRVLSLYEPSFIVRKYMAAFEQACRA